MASTPMSLDEIERLIADGDGLFGPPVSVDSPTRRYTLGRLLGVGDVSDVFLATAEGGGRSYVFKASRVPEGAAVLLEEKAAVAEVLTAAGDTHYRRYFPTLADSFAVRDRFPKRVNVFLHESGFWTLEEVLRRHPDGLDGRHLAWVFKRLLTALGFAHRQGRIHGAPLPCHVLVHPESHGLLLVGWGQSVKDGDKIAAGPAKYLPWYPPEVTRNHPAGASTDIYLAAKTMVFLGGGDPAAGRIPESVPPALRRFLGSCLLEGPRMRPGDAWGLLDEFDELLGALYGPPKFHVLDM
jgi:serine/threonine protein kinase